MGEPKRTPEHYRDRHAPFDAYYYGFDPTGDPDIDAILIAVAAAGKAFHLTADWQEEGGSGQGTPQEWIQSAANDAAARRKEPQP